MNNNSLQDLFINENGELEENQFSKVDYINIIENFPFEIKIFNSEFEIVYLNRKAKEEHHLENKTNEKIKNWDFLQCVEEDKKDFLIEKIKSSIQIGKAEDFELKYNDPLKKEWRAISLVPIKNKKNKTNYVLFISRDITKEKLIEEESNLNLKKAEETKYALFNILEDVKESEKNLQEERDKSQAIISSMAEGLFVLDIKSRVVLMNSRAESILGVDFNKVLGKEIKEIITITNKDGKEISEIDLPIEKVFKTGQVINITIEDQAYYKTSSGKIFPVALTASPLKDEITSGVVVIFRDISDEKKLDEAKSSFISIASHQLRTPLTAIRWYTEMLDSDDAGPLNPDQKAFLTQIYDATLRLNDILSMLLNMARIEGGRVKIEPAKIDLTSAIQQTLQTLEPSIQEKKLKTKITIIPQDFSPIAFLDPSMLDQVISNLISNATRYTNEKGGIEIIVDGSNKDEIKVSVKDDGIGIPKEFQEKIFEKFFRADNAMLKVPSGNGLGLSLVKNLVEIWGGNAGFESPTEWINKDNEKEFKGTAFYFTIPLKSKAI